MMLTAYPRNRVLFIAGILIATLLCRNVAGQTPVSADELLAQLKTRDAVFDNLRVSYLRYLPTTLQGPQWNTHQPDDPVWKDPRIEEFAGKTRRLTLHEAAIVRGDRVTFIWELDQADVDYFKTVPRGIGIPAPYQYRSNIGKNVRHYSALPDDLPQAGGDSGFLIEEPASEPSDGLQEKWMSTELAFGVGYGKRTREIRQIHEVPEGWNVEAAMSLTGLDDSVAQLVIDREFIVRSAQILWHLPDGGEYRTTVETSGTVHIGGVTLGKSGHYTQTVYTGQKRADGTEDTSVRDEIEIVFEALRRNLTDNEYAAMTSLSADPSTEPGSSGR